MPRGDGGSPEGSILQESLKWQFADVPADPIETWLRTLLRALLQECAPRTEDGIRDEIVYLGLPCYGLTIERGGTVKSHWYPRSPLYVNHLGTNSGTWLSPLAALVALLSRTSPVKVKKKEPFSITDFLCGGVENPPPILISSTSGTKPRLGPFADLGGETRKPWQLSLTQSSVPTLTETLSSDWKDAIEKAYVDNPSERGETESIVPIEVLIQRASNLETPLPDGQNGDWRCSGIDSLEEDEQGYLFHFLSCLHASGVPHFVTVPLICAGNPRREDSVRLGAITLGLKKLENKHFQALARMVCYALPQLKLLHLREYRAMTRSPDSGVLRHNFHALYHLPEGTIRLLEDVRIPHQSSFHSHGEASAPGERPDNGESSTAAGEVTQTEQDIAGLIRQFPKTDLHVHVGSCMQPEFLVYASFVGLLRHAPGESWLGEGLPAACKWFRAWTRLQEGDGADKVKDVKDVLKNADRGPARSFVKEWKGIFKREGLGRGEPGDAWWDWWKDIFKREGLGRGEPGDAWWDCMAGQVRRASKKALDSKDRRAYREWRAVLHTDLNIRDDLKKEQVRACLDDTLNINLAFFGSRHVLRFGPDHDRRWKKDDLVRIYLLVLAASKRYKSASLSCAGKEAADCLEWFRLKKKPSEAEWERHRDLFYEDGEHREEDQNPFSIISLQNQSWRIPANARNVAESGRGLPNLELPRRPWADLPAARELTFDADPIEWSLATGQRSSNLAEYLAGCEFTGAEHLRHPFLIHLYAQQALLDFARQGTAYAELRASPGGYIASELGFTFPDACRSLLEAFGQAQTTARRWFRKMSAENGQQEGKTAWKDEYDPWIGSLLGEKYDLKEFPLWAQSTRSHERPLPPKVNLIFVGKRHKTTREMMLEAAAAAVLRPAAEGTMDDDAFEKELERCRVVGFDLAGQEVGNPPERFTEEFSRMSRLHIPVTVHAGENASSEFVENAILALGATRLGHALSLAEDPKLMARVRDQRVGVELCPVGNHQTSIFSAPVTPFGMRPYPVRNYMTQGLMVSINTDNPVTSRTTLVQEYFQASYAWGAAGSGQEGGGQDKPEGLSLWNALRIIRMGFLMSFLSLPERRKLLDAVEERLVALLTHDRTVLNLQVLLLMQGNSAVDEYLQSIRAEEPLDPILSAAILRHDLIDDLRRSTKRSDAPKVLRLAGSQHRASQRIGISLLKAVVSDPSVRKWLRDKWSRSESVPIRISVAFRLLDDPTLEEHCHRDILRFVLDHWEEWIAENLQYAGGDPSELVRFCKNRVLDPTVPNSKKWIYICCAAGSDDRKEVQKIIEQVGLRRQVDAFVAEVATKVLAKLGEAPDGR